MYYSTAFRFCSIAHLTIIALGMALSVVAAWKCQKSITMRKYRMYMTIIVSTMLLSTLIYHCYLGVCESRVGVLTLNYPETQSQYVINENKQTYSVLSGKITDFRSMDGDSGKIDTEYSVEWFGSEEEAKTHLEYHP